MKIIFGYYEDESFGLTEYSEIEFSSSDKQEDIERKGEYKRYLLTGIMEDFQYPEVLSEFYEEIKMLERGEIDELLWDGQSFQHKIDRERVTFIHTIFGICEEYPLWSCRFKEYRKVLKVWKDFLNLPRKEQTKLEVKI